MKTYLNIIGVMALASSLTFAEEGQKGPRKPGGPGKHRPNPEVIFEKLDADGSGSVTIEEFKSGPRAKENPEKAGEIFKKIDKDANGEVSLEEFKSHRPPHHRKPKKDGDDAPAED